MKKLVLFLLMALCVQSLVIAKGNKKQKLQNYKSSHKHESFTLNKELKGFEVDYLSNKDFKTKVESKKFWGLIELVVDFVASWFNTTIRSLKPSLGRGTVDFK